jgi:hypothetical protein
MSIGPVLVYIRSCGKNDVISLLLVYVYFLSVSPSVVRVLGYLSATDASTVVMCRMPGRGQLQQGDWGASTSSRIGIRPERVNETRDVSKLSRRNLQRMKL